MRTFTDKEIELCEKIFELGEEKKVEYGDLAYSTHRGTIELWTTTKNPMRQFLSFPLWQEHDCLEWLMEKEWSIYDTSWICEPRLKICYIKPGQKSKEHKIGGNADTLLECLLRAVLAVMEESGK